MRVVVDYDLCESNALCMAAAPEVFEVRDDDFLYVLNEEPPEDFATKWKRRPEPARRSPSPSSTEFGARGRVMLSVCGETRSFE